VTTIPFRISLLNRSPGKGNTSCPELLVCLAVSPRVLRARGLSIRNRKNLTAALPCLVSTQTLISLFLSTSWSLLSTLCSCAKPDPAAVIASAADETAPRAPGSRGAGPRTPPRRFVLLAARAATVGCRFLLAGLVCLLARRRRIRRSSLSLLLVIDYSAARGARCSNASDLRLVRRLFAWRAASKIAASTRSYTPPPPLDTLVAERFRSGQIDSDVGVHRGEAPRYPIPVGNDAGWHLHFFTPVRTCRSRRRRRGTLREHRGALADRTSMAARTSHDRVDTNAHSQGAPPTVQQGSGPLLAVDLYLTGAH